MMKIIDFFIHFIRRVLFWLYYIIYSLICIIIFLITYDSKLGVITKRKIRRIRTLTKFKLFLWKNFSWFFTFIEVDDYYKNLEKRFINGM